MTLQKLIFCILGTPAAHTIVYIAHIRWDGALSSHSTFNMVKIIFEKNNPFICNLVLKAFQKISIVYFVGYYNEISQGEPNLKGYFVKW